MKVAVVDYGMGNLWSVEQALRRVGVSSIRVSTPEELSSATCLVLPGVGAFGAAMGELESRGLAEPIRDHVRADRPFLGICLGLQLLFEVGLEGGERTPGLGLIPGEVVPFPLDLTDEGRRLKIPHMGWNEVQIEGAGRDVFQGIPQGAHFYFVHSYHVVPAEDSIVAATTRYGGKIVVAVARGSLFATQFHPEKSQTYGRQLLANFLDT